MIFYWRPGWGGSPRVFRWNGGTLAASTAGSGSGTAPNAGFIVCMGRMMGR